MKRSFPALLLLMAASPFAHEVRPEPQIWKLNPPKRELFEVRGDSRKWRGVPWAAMERTVSRHRSPQLKGGAG